MTSPADLDLPPADQDRLDRFAAELDAGLRRSAAASSRRDAARTVVVVVVPVIFVAGDRGGRSVQ